MENDCQARPALPPPRLGTHSVCASTCVCACAHACTQSLHSAASNVLCIPVHGHRVDLGKLVVTDHGSCQARPPTVVRSFHLPVDYIYGFVLLPYFWPSGGLGKEAPATGGCGRSLTHFTHSFIHLQVLRIFLKPLFNSGACVCGCVCIQMCELCVCV